MNENLTLQKRRLQGRTIDDRSDSGLDLSSADAYGAIVSSSTFSHCDLSMAILKNTVLTEVTFERCDLRFANFQGAKLYGCRFVDCDLRTSMFVSCHPLDRVIFENCRLQYASFYDSTIRAASWRDCNLHGADLRFIEADALGGVSFLGCNLWNVSVRVGCAFFNAVYDERSADFFVAIAARLHPDQKKSLELVEIAGEGYNTVTRLMETKGD